MTHVDNVASILQDGLHARNSLDGKFRDIADAGANARRDRLDPIYHLSVHNYVPFYFNAVNPMLSARRENLPNLVIVGVSVAAILRSDSRWLITDGNAASSGTGFFNAVEDLERLDWNCLRAKYWNDILDGKRTRCAEMLVESHVHAKCIVKVECFTRKVLTYVTTLVAQHSTQIHVAGRRDPF